SGNITTTGAGGVSEGNVAGKLGRATSYNGSTQDYSLGNNSILRPENITISSWVYQNAWTTVGFSAVITQTTTSSPFGGYKLGTGYSSSKRIDFEGNFNGTWG